MKNRERTIRDLPDRKKLSNEDSLRLFNLSEVANRLPVLPEWSRSDIICVRNEKGMDFKSTVADLLEYIGGQPENRPPSKNGEEMDMKKRKIEVDECYPVKNGNNKKLTIKDFKCSCGKVFEWKNVHWNTKGIKGVKHICECGLIQHNIYELDQMKKEWEAARNDKKLLKSFVENRLGEKWELPQQKPEWKILDIGDLSEWPDILTGDYDFRWTNRGAVIKAFGKHSSINDRLEFIKNNNICYRPATTEKSHEELAEDIKDNLAAEMIKETNHENGLEGIVQDSLLFILRKLSEIIVRIESMEEKS